MADLKIPDGVLDAQNGSHIISRDLQNGHSAQPYVNGVGLHRKRVGLLITDKVYSLQALLDHCQDPENHSAAEVVLVISNKPDVEGLKRAERAGIPTQVISHKGHKTREEFDAKLHEALVEADVDIVCLAGFMRILTGEFVRKWDGRMINCHPSLLPAFKGYKAVRQAIAARVCICGATVHFVAEEVDSGAILAQESVPVYPTDTEETLVERVKLVECSAFPKALELVASGRATLGENNMIQWKV